MVILKAKCSSKTGLVDNLESLIFRFAKIYYQKRFNDRSTGFPFGQQPVKV